MKIILFFVYFLFVEKISKMCICGLISSTVPENIQTIRTSRKLRNIMLSILFAILTLFKTSRKLKNIMLSILFAILTLFKLFVQFSEK